MWKYNAMYHLIGNHFSGAPTHQFQGSYWFKFLSLKRRKRLCVFQNTEAGRTIFSDGYELGHTRKRSHDQKRNRLGEILEYILLQE
jgi:hypothetical protein